MDTVLRELVVVFRDRLRVSDRVFRYSTAADEFLILLPEATLPDAASLCRQRLFEAIETHRFAVDDITLSVGLGQLREADTEEELVKRSDVAMGVAKEESRHRNTLVLDDDPRVEQGPSPGSAGSA